MELDSLLKRLVGYEDVAEEIRAIYEERTMNMSEWQSVESAPENVVVLTKLDDEHGARNEGPLMRKGRLWWTPDGEIYVYYTPTHWKPANGQ
mgnify:FL=1